MSCDISDEMMRLTKSKFEDPNSEYLVIPGNKAVIADTELAPMGSHDFCIDEHIKTLGFTEKDRVVLGGIVNNECLPFKSGSFDCYLANLSLMLVDNHRNMLAEAFRVT